MHHIPVHDCTIVGAGPAGLTAATYLQRFRRDIVVLDAGRSRARWIPSSHNCPGFPFGVAGNELLARFRTHAEEYGATIVEASIERLRRDGDGFVAGTGDGRQWRARHVILATGVVDRLPELEGLEDAIAAGVVRLCAVCDAYEARDETIGVLAPAATAVSHAGFLRTFSRRVVAIDSDGETADAALRRRADGDDIRLRPRPTRLALVDGACRAEFADGDGERFDTLYPVLGADVQSGLATRLGATADDNGALIVDDRMQTSIDGLYAIGDVVSALNQISVAVGHAAIAATAVHRRLPANHC